MCYDELWPGGPRFLRDAGGFPLSTDSVLLAHFAPLRQARRVLDLGCGAGVLTLLLRRSIPDATVEGIELQPEAAALCRENLRENGFPDENILTGDLRDHRSLFPAGAYDLVVSNPPYFAEGSGLSAPDIARATARDERSCTREDLCAAAAYLCRWGGSFALVYRPERLAELFCALSAHGLEAKRLRLVQHRYDAPPNLALVEARRGGQPGLTVEAPLLLTGPDGGDSEEIKLIYHRG